ncbi:hypothetical protein T265_00876 [Opisthorchis viverrini]|uniref:Glycoside hydrolase family 19 catalytic domain-containing protein n=2 Tax=Opisthorchis viverrini TaxID=6198 RepID=A0A075A0I0_OPIVI|nr:hypothetical protein T265_00876 [Opisthorchis viverrini]KER33178.1 hypothetical protein T265_00876 [Opisthorchis viverrini]
MVSKLISRQKWEQLVAADGYYSYDNFIKAAEKVYPDGFLNHGTEAEKLRELAAFLASVAHETDGFKLTEHTYKMPQVLIGSKYYPSPGRMYYGRGPLMLNWNGNYGSFSAYFFKDQQRLLDDPDEIARDGYVGFSSALWLWMTQPNEMTSPHNSIYRDLCRHKNWGFGRTVLAIGASMENTCESENKRLAKRIELYRHFADALNVTVGVLGEQLNTFGMRRTCE